MTTGQEYNAFQINNNAEARSVFEFLAHNTNVEWGMIRFDGTGNIITTDHNIDKISSAVDLAAALYQIGHVVTAVVHDHPVIEGAGLGPSGYDPTDSSYYQKSNDFKNYEAFNADIKNAGNQVRFFEYNVVNSTYYMYDKDGFEAIPN